MVVEEDGSIQGAQDFLAEEEDAFPVVTFPKNQYAAFGFANI